MPTPSAPTIRPQDTIRVKPVRKPRPTQISERVDPETAQKLAKLAGKTRFVFA